jgi:DNA-binding XRE family transcriptional regulator
MRKVNFTPTDKKTVESNKIRGDKQRKMVAEIAEKAVNRHITYKKQEKRLNQGGWKRPIHPMVSEMFRSARKGEGLTMREAAKKQGVSSYYWISNLENGRTSPSLTKVWDYANSLGYEMQIVLKPKK